MARPVYGYRNSADKKVVGSTTALKAVTFMDSDILCGWTEKVTKLGKSWRAERNAAGAHGTIFHELAEHHLPMPWCPEWAELASLPAPQVEKLKASYEAVRAWWLENKPKVIHAEEALVSEDYQFGGTFDAVVELWGALWLLDYKTGSMVGAKECAQMASYRRLLLEKKDIVIEGAVLIHAPTKHPGTMRAVKLTGEMLDAGWDIFRIGLEVGPKVKALDAVME